MLPRSLGTLTHACVLLPALPPRRVRPSRLRCFVAAVAPAVVPAAEPAVLDDELRSATSPPSQLVLGVDPDVHGALVALRWTPGAASPATAHVFDTPATEVQVGAGLKARLRLRHDPVAMSALLTALAPPPGTLVVLERPHARQGVGVSGAFQSGCGLGLWWGVLAAHGVTVRTTSPAAWKRFYKLVVRSSRVCPKQPHGTAQGAEVIKDDSRALAAAMFPEHAVELARKLDHGRAEALLIAAYGLLDASSKAGKAAMGAGAPELQPELIDDVRARHAAAAAALAATDGRAVLLAGASGDAKAAKWAARAVARELSGVVAKPRAIQGSDPRTLIQLRSELRERGLPVSGSKAVLLERLQE